MKAYFGSTETPYTVRQFFVDTTLPNDAVLSQPINGSTGPQGTITFLWGNGADPGTVNSPVTSTLEIAEDAVFITNVQTYSIQGSTVDVNLSAGTYYWRVTNTDEAGNSALASSTFEFTLF